MKKLIFPAAMMCCLSTFVSCNSKDGGNDSAKAQAAKVENATVAATDSAVVINNIMTRKSIRQFTSQPIEKETLDLLVKTGMAAPSAMNKQPWEFIVVSDKDVLNSLRENHPYSNLKTATAAIIVCGDLNKTIEGEGREYWVQDCSAATENILLAAHGLGLGAVWCGVYPVTERIDAVKSVLGIPDNIVPLNIITLGYPAENPAPKDKWNPEAVHYQKW